MINIWGLLCKLAIIIQFYEPWVFTSEHVLMDVPVTIEIQHLWSEIHWLYPQSKAIRGSCRVSFQLKIGLPRTWLIPTQDSPDFLLVNQPGMVESLCFYPFCDLCQRFRPWFSALQRFPRNFEDYPWKLATFLQITLPKTAQNRTTMGGPATQIIGTSFFSVKFSLVLSREWGNDP